MNFSTSQLFKHSAIGTAVFAALAANAIVPVLDTSSVTVTQRPDRTVVIEYTMNPAAANDDGAAIVTVDILTNAVGEAAASVGGEHLQTLSGDVNKIVTHTANYKHMILWEPKDEGMGEWTLPAAQVTAKVSLWATNSPPAYWVIDLTQPTDRMADRYYPEAGQIPLGVTNVLYKTDRLVMRRIPAKGVTWRMGSSASVGFSTYHYVTFSRDYWMAIYEMTQAQATNLVPTTYKQETWGSGVGPAKPYTCWNEWGTYGNLRTGASATSGWPVQGHEITSTGCLLYKIRTGLGGIMADLPTEAEWEFACRAGTSTSCPWGDSTSDYADYAWLKGNSGTTSDGYSKYDVATHDVGLKKPNNWGLYDMIGNIWEFCLDFQSNKSDAPVWDPEGAAYDDVDNGYSADYKYARCARGGCYYSAANVTSTTAIGSKLTAGGGARSHCGFRICIEIP